MNPINESDIELELFKNKIKIITPFLNIEGDRTMLEGLGIGSQDVPTPDAIQFRKKRPA